MNFEESNKILKFRNQQNCISRDRLFMDVVNPIFHSIHRSAPAGGSGDLKQRITNLRIKFRAPLKVRNQSLIKQQSFEFECN